MVRAARPDLSSTGAAATAVALSASALAMGSYGTLAFAPIAPLVRVDLDLSRAQIGLLTALVFLGASIASVPAGRLTDRFGAAPVLAAAMAGVSGALVVVATSPAALVFLAAVFAVGLAYGNVTPPTNVIVRGSATTRHGGLLMSIKQTGVTFGGLIAGLTLPSLAHAVGWRGALLAPAGACLVVAVMALALRRTLTEQSAWDARLDPAPLDLPGRWRIGIGAFGLLMAGVQLSFVTHLTTYLVEDFHYGLPIAGVALAVAMASSTIGRIAWAVVSDRRFATRRHVGLRLNALVALVSLTALAFVAESTLAWVFVAVTGFASIGWNGVYMAMVSESVAPAQIGRASGDALRVIFLGPVLIPPLIGLAADRAGWRAGWLLCAFLVAIAALGLTYAGRVRHDHRYRNGSGSIGSPEG